MDIHSEEETAPLISKDSPGSSTENNHFKGRGQKLLVTLCILITELCERLTFYGLTANLILFCGSELGLKAPLPSTINYLFQGTCYLIPLFGGWLADAHLGRFNTIYGSSLLYVVGTILLAAVSVRNKMLASWFDDKSFAHDPTIRLVYFAISLVLISFGTGGIKANVSPFGADQVQKDGPRAIQTFFNWFYWFINIGSLIAFTVVVWVQQKNVFYGYVITAGTMFLGVIAFLSGRKKYLNKPPGGSQLTDTAKIIYEAIKNRGSANALVWLDNAKNTCGGKYTEAKVEDVKILLRILPVFALFIVYWTIYSQMQSTFLIQATYMKLEFKHFTIPAASLSIFDIVAVLAFIPIMDHVVYPLVQFCGIRFTPLRRIGVGLLLAAASVVVAGLIERWRRHVWQAGGVYIQTVFDEKREASTLNVFWQVPQFMLVGSSEVLTSITGLELAYSQSPQHMKGLVMGAFLVTSGLGNYVATLLVVIVRSASNNKWYPSEDPNTGELENFFFLLAGLMMLNFVVFLLIASSYKYKTATRREEINSNVKDAGQSSDRDV